MTFAEIKSAVLEILVDPGGDFYTDQIVSKAVNAANSHINSIEARLRPENIALTWAVRDTIASPPTKSYALPADAVHLKAIEIVESQAEPHKIIRQLVPVAIPTGHPQYFETVQRTSFNNPGDVTHYLARLRQVDLYPTPGSIVTMRIWFDKRFLPLSIPTDIPNTTMDHYWLATHAAYLASLANPVEIRDDLLAIYKEKEADHISAVSNWGGMQVTAERMGGMWGY